MSMTKRIFSLLLSVVLLAGMLVVPAGAASVGAARSFSDVTDGATAAAVESLRLLGVLDGYGDGTFRPGASLTRAQFCKMELYAMNASGELGKYRLVTVYPDVKPSYWAASYINMASKGKSIIAGYPNGNFQPERTVTVGQAVTILVRLLGYKDEDVGGVWPEGHMAQASEIGLTDGVGTDAAAALTRGQAAKLFLNLLRMNNKDGTAYVSTIAASVKSGVMLVSSAAAGTDGSKTAMQLGSGTTYQMANKASTGLLNGYKGSLLLDKGGKVLTFVPDSLGTSKTITLAKSEAAKLTDTSGTQYTIASTVSMYYNNEETTWGESYALLNPGVSLTLYFGASGGVEYVFAGGGSTASNAVIVYAKGSTAGFTALTGGSSTFTIYKDGAPATAADMRPYDVATFSGATNSIRVCDVRLTGYYENCAPNTAAPTSVTVLGHEFNVLPSATEMLSKFKLGQQVTLLLTEDNQVAGALEATGTSGATGNAIGIATSVSTSKATVSLLSGVTVSGSVNLSESDVGRMSGQLVRVSSSQRGYISMSPLTGGVSGDLDVVKKTLGTRMLSDNVMIFEKTATGLTAISLASLTDATIRASQITYAGSDWAGRVNVLVLVTSASSDYIFGIARYTQGYTVTSTDEEGNTTASHVNATLELVTPTKTYGPYSTGYSVSNGAFVGIKLNGDKLGSVLTLTTLGNVPSSGWSATGAVTVSGRTYTVPDSVLCYNSASGGWLTLAQARAFASTSTLYVDSYGIVRGVMVR